MLGKMDMPLHGKCLRLTNYKNIKQEEPRVILCLVFLFVVGMKKYTYETCVLLETEGKNQKGACNFLSFPHVKHEVVDKQENKETSQRGLSPTTTYSSLGPKRQKGCGF